MVLKVHRSTVTSIIAQWKVLKLLQLFMNMAVWPDWAFGLRLYNQHLEYQWKPHIPCRLISRLKYSIWTSRHGDRGISPLICLLTSSSDECIVTATSAVSMQIGSFSLSCRLFSVFVLASFQTLSFWSCACVPLFNLSYFFVSLPVPRSYVNPFLFDTIKNRTRF